MGKISSFSPFAYLFKHFFISVWTHAYLFYTSLYNLIFPYVFCCSNCSSLGPREIFQVGSCVLLTCPHPLLYFILFFFSTFLLSGTVRRSSSSCIFCAPSLNQTFLRGAQILSNEEWYLETKIQTLSVLIVHWCVPATRPSQWTELGNICMYTNQCRHLYL